MTHALAPADAIAQAIASADKSVRIFHRPWHRQPSALAGSPSCDYCLAPLDLNDPHGAVLDYLVPVSLGGPGVEANRVLACASCTRQKGQRDLVAWSDFESRGTQDSRKALLDRRTDLLAQSLNHLPPTARYAPKARVREAMEERWAGPRFTVYAFHGTERSWIGWTPRNGAQDAHALAAVLLRFSCQAVPHTTAKLTLYELDSSRLLDALWVLIDHHAIVRQLYVPTLNATPADPDNWQHYWPVLLDNLDDLRRRRTRRPGKDRADLPLAPGQDPNLAGPRPAPLPPRPLSTNSRAVKAREKRAATAKRQAWGTYLEARASLDAFKENVRRGLVENPSLAEWDLIEREVLELCP